MVYNNSNSWKKNSSNESLKATNEHNPHDHDACMQTIDLININYSASSPVNQPRTRIHFILLFK